jgi:hypothetical protein
MSFVPSLDRARSGSDTDANRRRDLAAWGTVAVLLVADVALTHVGLASGFTEANPFARAMMDAVGVVPAMALLKAAAVGVAVVGWTILPRPGRYVVPVALAIPWAIAVAINASVVLGAGGASVPAVPLPSPFPLPGG